MRFMRNYKLVDWCLEVIIENLDLFIFNKTVPQKYIDFLLRVYSKEVFRQYRNLNTITEECMLWFLNPHNKKITLSTVTPNAIKQLKITGSTITSLNLHDSLATENILNSIMICVPNVRYLDLSSTFCSDKTIICLQRVCPDLVTLNIRDCEKVTDNGIIDLCKNKQYMWQHLKNLDITNTEIAFIGLHELLKRLPSIQCIKFYNMADTFYAIYEEQFMYGACENIRYNLTELIYQGIGYTDKPLRVILLWSVLCPNVKRIHFLFPVKKDVLHACTKFQNLEEIKITQAYDNKYMKIKDVLAPIMQIASNLKILILSSVEVPTVTLIENFKNLKCLYLLNVHFTDFIEEDIKTTETKLDTLVIKETNFKPPSTYRSVALLISLSKKVTKLYLNRLKALPQDIFHIILSSMKNLTFVDFSYIKVKTNLIIHFLEIPSMKMIYLDLCKCFSPDKHPTLRSVLSQNSTCTLSWRIMNDNSDDSDSDALSMLELL